MRERGEEETCKLPATERLRTYSDECNDLGSFIDDINIGAVLFEMIMPLVYVNESVTDAWRIGERGIFPPCDKSESQL